MPRIPATTGDDYLIGTDDHDYYRGGPGSNHIDGGGGDDYLWGGSRNDTLLGGTGDDYLRGDRGDDTLVGGPGNDLLRGEEGDDRLFGGDGDDSLLGWSGNDTLYGNSGNDSIRGGLGDDTLWGGAGNDLVVGNEGDDLLFGEGGDDRIRGGAGPGNDFLSGGAGDDILLGQDGDDLIDGGDGADFILAGQGADRAEGGGGNDRIGGGGGDDRILGGDGDDIATGNGGNDSFTGGAGNDRFDGGGGPADLASFSGNYADYEVIRYPASGQIIVRDLRAGSPDGTDTLFRVEILSFADGTVDVAGGILTFSASVAPVFTSGASASAEENQTVAYLAQASGEDGSALVYSLSGADAPLFTVDATTGEVSFIAAPNYEMPSDVDGDNVYDIVVTASDGNRASEQVVAIGVSDVLEPILDLTTLDASQGFILQANTSSQTLGWRVASAGDVNGDGYDDLIVRPPGRGDLIDSRLYVQPGTQDQEAYVVFGAASGVDVDLTTLDAGQGFIIRGGAEFLPYFVHFDVSSAGDVNGDGYDDLIVGAGHGDDGGSSAGEAYIVFGSATGFGTDVDGRQVIDLTTLSAAEGFIIQGDAAFDWAGRAVSSAGDINGDGYDDLIVGALGGDDGGDNAGEAYVVFGSASDFGVDVGGRQVIDLTTLSAIEGFIIQGVAAGARLGSGVSSAGDVNGDGYDDLLVGASFGDDGPVRTGEAYVVFGSASGFGVDVGGRQVIDLTTLTASQGFIIKGDVTEDWVFTSVSSAGDVNGDGYDDLIVGAEHAGEAYVVFGSASGFGVDVGGRQVIDLTRLSPSEGFIIQGDSPGFAFSSAGDVNGDGYDDLIVGARLSDDGGSFAGQAYVVFGSSGIIGDIVSVDGYERQVLDPANRPFEYGFIIQGDAAFDEAGSSVSSAGDVNGDGYDDLIVGAEHSGEAYVVFGSATGSTSGLTATGTAGANTMIGSAGDDTLTGAGGADVIRSGAGDDIIGISDNGFLRIDGGGGDDTLRVDGSGVNLNFANIAQNAVTGIERIDLTGSGNNTLTVSVLDIFDMIQAREGGTAILRVTGNAGDAAYLSDAGWTAGAQVVEGSITYNTWSNGNALAYIQSGVTVTLGSVGPSQDDLDAGKDVGVVVMDTTDQLAGQLIDPSDAGWRSISEFGTDLSAPDHRFITLVELHDLGGELRSIGETAAQPAWQPIDGGALSEGFNASQSHNVPLPANEAGDLLLLSDTATDTHHDLIPVELIPVIAAMMADTAFELIDPDASYAAMTLDTAEGW